MEESVLLKSCAMPVAMTPRAARRSCLMTSQLRDGLRYALAEPRVLWPTVLAGVFGLCAASLPVSLASFAHSVFHSGPSGYGLLSATVAVGSVAGALICARLPRPRVRILLAYGAALATLYLVAAAVPGQIVYAALLVPIGACTLLLLTSTNSVVQTAAPDDIRGRIMGLYLLVFIGGAALGGPLLGFVDEHAGPRSGMLLAGVVPAVAVVLIAAKLTRDRARRVRHEGAERHLSLV